MKYLIALLALGSVIFFAAGFVHWNQSQTQALRATFSGYWLQPDDPRLEKVAYRSIFGGDVVTILAPEQDSTALDVHFEQITYVTEDDLSTVISTQQATSTLTLEQRMITNETVFIGLDGPSEYSVIEFFELVQESAVDRIFVNADVSKDGGIQTINYLYFR